MYLLKQVEIISCKRGVEIGSRLKIFRLKSKTFFFWIYFKTNTSTTCYSGDMAGSFDNANRKFFRSSTENFPPKLPKKMMKSSKQKSPAFHPDT